MAKHKANVKLIAGPVKPEHVIVKPKEVKTTYKGLTTNDRKAVRTMVKETIGMHRGESWYKVEACSKIALNHCADLKEVPRGLQQHLSDACAKQAGLVLTNKELEAPTFGFSKPMIRNYWNAHLYFDGKPPKSKDQWFELQVILKGNIDKMDDYKAGKIDRNGKSTVPESDFLSRFGRVCGIFSFRFKSHQYCQNRLASAGPLIPRTKPWRDL